MNTCASGAIGHFTGFFCISKARDCVTLATVIAAAFIVLPLAAQAADEVTEAKAEAEAILRAANEDAARIRGEALKNAAQIEADAVRKAAQIEAEAIRNAARAFTPSAEAAPSLAPLSPTSSVAAPRERYRNLTGVWSWKGNARNRKFEVKQDETGAVTTELFMSPRTRFYREDLHYHDGVLSGRTFQTVKTQTGNDEKRFREFQLSISEDGGSLVGTIIDSTEKNNYEKRLDVIWNRVRD